MKTAGVIAEFNPFHSGHAEHLNETRKKFDCEKIIAVMSGNFVQRGEPAIYNKWQRTETALRAGVDIVIELPVPYVISGADYFARAGVALLAATGVVDALSFGSESGDITTIKEAGKILAEEPDAYKKILRENLDNGSSFAAARGAALSQCLPKAPSELFSKPNNCLAIEYCKALNLLREPMEAFTTQRRGGGASATKIRKALREDCAKIATLDDFTDIFKYLLFSREFNLGEGLENRFRKFCGELDTLSNFLAAVKTKRYTFTRLQRSVIGMILNITADELGEVQYIRVLGFRKESADLLGKLTKKAALPVITHGAAIDKILREGGSAAKMLAKDLEAGDIYRCATRERGGFRSERARSVIKI
jgi:predicted nucleotidyltransferase